MGGDTLDAISTPEKSSSSFIKSNDLHVFKFRISKLCKFMADSSSPSSKGHFSGLRKGLEEAESGLAMEIEKEKRAAASGRSHHFVALLVARFGATREMAENMENYDDILDLACDCNQMSVVKTRWYGENAGWRSGRRMDRLIEKHQTEMNNVKKKQEFTVIVMFVLFSLMMNMVLGAVGQEAVVEDGGYSSESD
ncbi:hypothetical protein AgCh_004564 [Apium graveolens]